MSARLRKANQRINKLESVNEWMNELIMIGQACALLIERGARLDARARDGKTPFNYAAQVKQTFIFCLFVSASASLCLSRSFPPFNYAEQVKQNIQV